MTSAPTRPMPKRPPPPGPGGGEVNAGAPGRHQFDSAARQPHRHWPKRIFPPPVCAFIQVLAQPTDCGFATSDNDISLDLRIVAKFRVGSHRVSKACRISLRVKKPMRGSSHAQVEFV